MHKNASLRTNFILYFPILFLVISCSSDSNQVDVPEDIAVMGNVAIYSGDAEPLQDITFERVARFGDTGDIYIGSIAGVAVRDDGTLFLADRGEAIVHVFGPTGDYRTAIGGKGEGPGEFQTIIRPELRDENLYVFDLDQQRLSIFSAEDYTFTRTFSLGDKQDISGRPVSIELLPDERILVLYSSSEREENRLNQTEMPVILDNEGEIISSGFVTLTENNRLLVGNNGLFQIFSMPFLGQNLLDVTRDGEIATGFTDRFLLHFLSLEGDTLRSVYHDITPPVLDRSAIMNNVNSQPIRSEISSMDLPETRQAFNSLMVDDENRLWVSSPTDESDIYEWRVLSANGEKLAQFNQTSSSSLQLVKNGHAYFLEENEETGVADVVKYHFTLQ